MVHSSKQNNWTVRVSLHEMQVYIPPFGIFLLLLILSAVHSFCLSIFYDIFRHASYGWLEEHAAIYLHSQCFHFIYCQRGIWIYQSKCVRVVFTQRLMVWAMPNKYVHFVVIVGTIRVSRFVLKLNDEIQSFASAFASSLTPHITQKQKLIFVQNHWVAINF